MSWLETHFEEFVWPNLTGTVSSAELSKPLGYFEPEELTVIKNAWRSLKKQARGHPIFLPGRDVFIFEILARRENYPTVFIPECSRMTVMHISKNLPSSVRNCFLFDTGFAGSIPQALKSERFSLLSHHLRDSTKIQVFPRLTFSRGLALKIENTPKYWESGRLIPKGLPPKDAVYQPMSREGEFVQAARLTVEVYTNSAPKFINHHRPIDPIKEV